MFAEAGVACEPFVDPAASDEEDRIEGNGDDGTSKNHIAAFRGHEPMRNTKGRKDEGEFTDLCEASGDEHGRLQWVAEEEDNSGGCDGFTDHDDARNSKDLKRMFEKHGWIEKHADGDEEEDGEG